MLKLAIGITAGIAIGAGSMAAADIFNIHAMAEGSGKVYAVYEANVTDEAADTEIRIILPRKAALMV
jgi:hypothetical protein